MAARIHIYGVPGPVRLPHRNIAQATLLVVERAIRLAWRLLLEDPEFNLAAATEDEITAQLAIYLENRVLHARLVGGFGPDLFCVPRESKVPNFDATKPDLMPDLWVRLIGTRDVSVPSHDGLFAECKPIGLGHAVGGTYCDDGLIRFIVGDYAWAMEQAIMIGYADPKYVLPAKLSEALDRQSRPATMPTTYGPRICPRSTADTISQRVHVTRHRRNFVYPLTGEPAPEITIRHLWLNRS